jgi:ferredoxin
MRKMIANAMLCLLLLLSVGIARCESVCAVAAMPAMAASAMDGASAMPHDDAMVTDSGMEHCQGMRADHNNLPDVDAGCGQMNCPHQALPPSADFRVVTDGSGLLVAVVLPVTEHVVVAVTRTLDAVDHPLAVPLSPLEQTSMLRV